jgi:hypothetical protein
MTATEPRGKEDLARLHAHWQELHAQLREREQQLSAAVELYAKGRGARPDELMRDVAEMRVECSRRFRKLMQAMREPEPSGPAERTLPPRSLGGRETGS